MDIIHLDENRIQLVVNTIVHYADDYFFGELIKKDTRESGFYHFFETQYNELMQWLWEDNQLNTAETEYLLAEEAHSLKERIIETAADQLHAFLIKKGWLN